MDNCDQHVRSRRLLAYLRQHDNLIFLRKFSIQISWKQQMLAHLFRGRYPGQYLLYRGDLCWRHFRNRFPGVAIYCGGWCFRRDICFSRGAGGDEAEVAGDCFPHTPPNSTLDSGHWRLSHPLLYALGSLAGSPRRLSFWSFFRLYLQEKREILLLLVCCPALSFQLDFYLFHFL